MVELKREGAPHLGERLGQLLSWSTAWTTLHLAPALDERCARTAADAPGADVDHCTAQGGFHGKAMRADLKPEKWRTTRYQVRKAELPGNPNWFPVASFVAAVSGTSAQP